MLRGHTITNHKIPRILCEAFSTEFGAGIITCEGLLVQQTPFNVHRAGKMLIPLRTPISCRRLRANLHLPCEAKL